MPSAKLCHCSGHCITKASRLSASDQQTCRPTNPQLGSFFLQEAYFSAPSHVHKMHAHSVYHLQFVTLLLLCVAQCLPSQNPGPCSFSPLECPAVCAGFLPHTLGNLCCLFESMAFLMPWAAPQLLVLCHLFHTAHLR